MQDIGTKALGWAAIVLLAVGVAAGGTAQAATITNTTAVNGNGPADIGQDFFVPQFDSSLGTLTGASASLVGQFTPGIVFGFNSPPSSPPAPLLFNPLFSFNSSVQTLPAQTVAYAYSQALEVTGVPETIEFTEALPLSNLPVAGSTAALLDFYITASSGARLPAGAFFTADHGTFAAQLAVTYTYTPANSGAPVPEPASLILLGTGLIAFCTARSRGRKPASA